MFWTENILRYLRRSPTRATEDLEQISGQRRALTDRFNEGNSGKFTSHVTSHQTPQAELQKHSTFSALY